MCILTVRITEAFGLPKPSLFSNYKVILFLCHLRLNWIQIQVTWYLSSCWLVVNSHRCYYVTFWHDHILCGKYTVVFTVVFRNMTQISSNCLTSFVTRWRYEAVFTTLCNLHVINVTLETNLAVFTGLPHERTFFTPFNYNSRTT